MKARRLVHRGCVLASGLLLVRDAERRALLLFGPGMHLSRVSSGLVLHFAEPRSIRVDSALGHPLVELHGHLCTAPLQEDEASSQPAGILTVSAGRIVALGHGEPVDAAEWLELGLEVVAVSTLGLPPPPPQAAPRPTEKARAVFDDLVGEPSPEVIDLLENLGQARASEAYAGAAAAWMTGLRQLISSTGAGSGGGLREGPGVLQQLDGWLADRLAKMGMQNLVSAAHSRYLDELIGDFERGSLDDALKKAIPLGGSGGLAKKLAGLRAPGARQSLDFTRGGASSSIPLGDELMERLREVYRQALRKLVDEGRIDEAAFVQAELLDEPGEAVALLEAHERWARAAELAEVKELDQALAVRLWFLAGEVDRAVLAARRRGGMEGALSRLEARDERAALRLRVAWAANLAASGRYGAAVTLLEKVPGAERLVDSWLDAAIEGGGVGGATALRLALERRPDDWEALYDIAFDWLGGPAAPEVTRLAGALALGAGPTIDPLVRFAARRLMVLRSERGVNPGMDEALGRAVARSGGALSIDRPRGPLGTVPTVLSRRTEPLVLRFPDAGTGGLHALRWLRGRQRLLVARGESGIELRGRDGRLLRRWEQPAHELAVHAEGTLAVGLAHRGSLRRLARLNLTDGSGEHWCEAEIHGFCPTFRDPWIVAGDHEVLAIDLTHDGWRHTGRIGFDGPVRHLGAHQDGMFEFIAEDEMWSYRLPQMALDRRTSARDLLQRVVGNVSLDESGEGLVVALAQGDLDVVVKGVDGWKHLTPRGAGMPLEAAAHGLVCSSTWAVIAAGEELVVGCRRESVVRMRLLMPGGQPRFFLGEDHLVAWDDLGRIAVVDLQRGEVLADLRL